MSKMIYAYNIEHDEIADQHYAALYEERRRDACFVGAIQHGDVIHAFRDHLGLIPLYYRYTSNGVQFASDYQSLVQSTDTLSPMGTYTFTRFSTARLHPLFEEIHIVPPATVIEINPTTREEKVIYTYTMQPRHIPVNLSWNDLLHEFKHLMLQAVERTVKQDTVGLYLSGGIDSALVALMLKELGVSIHAYTSGPWGETSSDVQYALINADIIGVNQHEIDYLETADYEALMDDIAPLYRTPRGVPTVIGVTSLWKNTGIASEQQLYFGHNCDNMTASTTLQYLTLFLQQIPTPLRKRIHPAVHHRDLIENFFHLKRNFDADYHQLALIPIPDDADDMYRITLMATATSTNEIYTQPAVVNHILMGNPYYDVDVVEFSMGLPLNRRLRFKLDGVRPSLIFEKHLARMLAKQYLPEDVVERKKAFTVPFERDKQSQAFYDNLPRSVFDIPLKKPAERFAGDILKRWLKHIGYSSG